MVTRTAQPGSDDEAADEYDFLSLQQSGGLCWHWQAHGFHYGISQHYASVVSAGGTVAADLIYIGPNGVVSGSGGNLVGDVENHGTLMPGNSPGVLAWVNFTLSALGAILMAVLLPQVLMAKLDGKIMMAAEIPAILGMICFLINVISSWGRRTV